MITPYMENLAHRVKSNHEKVTEDFAQFILDSMKYPLADDVVYFPIHKNFTIGKYADILQPQEVEGITKEVLAILGCEGTTVAYTYGSPMSITIPDPYKINNLQGE